MIFLIEYIVIVFIPFVLIYILGLFIEPHVYVYAFYWIIAVIFIYHKATFKYKERIFNAVPIAITLLGLCGLLVLDIIERLFNLGREIEISSMLMPRLGEWLLSAILPVVIFIVLYSLYTLAVFTLIDKLKKRINSKKSSEIP